MQTKAIAFIVPFVLLDTPAFAAPAGMSAACNAAYQKYLSANGPKAFAKGATRGCGWSFRIGRNASLTEAKDAALRFCSENRGDGCKVVEEVN